MRTRPAPTADHQGSVKLRENGVREGRRNGRDGSVCVDECACSFSSCECPQLVILQNAPFIAVSHAQTRRKRLKRHQLKLSNFYMSVHLNY